MLVRNWMNPTVISIEAQASMAEALNLLKENQIKTLPVFDRETLVGVVTDRDLKRASASDATLLEIHELLHALTRIKVRDIMSRKPITIPDTYTVEEAAEVLRDHHISGAPVMDAKGRMVGMISQNDLFNALLVCRNQLFSTPIRKLRPPAACHSIIHSHLRRKNTPNAKSVSDAG